MSTQSDQYPQIYTAYLDELRQKLATAESELASASHTAAGKKADYDNKQKKFDIIDDGWQRIQGTNELAKKVIRVITENEDLAMRALGNSQLTRRGLKLLSMESEKVGDVVLTLQDKMEELTEALGQVTPKPDENGDIMKAVNQLKGAIDAAAAEALNSIPTVLEAFQTSAVLKNYMGYKGPSRLGWGIVQFLEDMLWVIDVAHGPKEPFKFPREECPRDYFEETREAQQAAATERNDAEQAWKEADVARELAVARRDAINESLQAAQTASTC